MLVASPFPLTPWVGWGPPRHRQSGSFNLPATPARPGVPATLQVLRTQWLIALRYVLFNLFFSPSLRTDPPPVPSASPLQALAMTCLRTIFEYPYVHLSLADAWVGEGCPLVPHAISMSSTTPFPRWQAEQAQKGQTGLVHCGWSASIGILGCSGSSLNIVGDPLRMLHYHTPGMCYLVSQAHVLHYSVLDHHKRLVISDYLDTHAGYFCSCFTESITMDL